MAINNILVPYDFSDCATDALRVAAKLSRLTGATLHLVHVYEDMTDFHSSNHRMREEIELRLDKVPELPFLVGVPMKRFMLRQFNITEMFRNDYYDRC